MSMANMGTTGIKRKTMHLKHKAVQLVLTKSGQATVEYLIVGVALLAIVLALGVLANRLEDGLFVEHAAQSASHSLGANTMGIIGDVLLY
jgi:hypothetical protein